MRRSRRCRRRISSASFARRDSSTSHPARSSSRPRRRVPTHCYVIRQGTVRGERPGGARRRDRAVGALRRRNVSVGRAHRAARRHERLSRHARHVLPRVSRRRLRRDARRRRRSSRTSARAASRTCSTSRGRACRRSTRPRRPSGADHRRRSRRLLLSAPVTCGPMLRSATRSAAMEEHRIGSVPIVDAGGKPIGIFTRQDVIGRVVLPQRPLTVAMRDVMSAPADHAARRRHRRRRGARHGAARHPPRRRRGRRRHASRAWFPSATSSACSACRCGSSRRRIRRAADIPALVAVRGRHPRAVAFAGGAGRGRRPADADDLEPQRPGRRPHHRADGAVRTICPGSRCAGSGWGRRAAASRRSPPTRTTACSSSPTTRALAPDAIRERLLPFARAVNEALDRCGYPLCKGGVMAMNPRWCASLAEWQAAFAGWIDRGDPQSLLAASIFFDFRALWGESRLADLLRAGIAERARGNARFLKQMSDNALRNRPPLNWRGELQAAEDDSGVEGIDLKMSGSVPFVDAARIFALAAGVAATNTVLRLRGRRRGDGMPAAEIDAWCNAFEYVQLLRLREQHRRLEAPARRRRRRESERGRLASLSDLDRRILKEAMRQIRKMQQRLELDYPGMSFGLQALARWFRKPSVERRGGPLGRRRHRDLGPRSRARSAPRHRRRRGGRRRHPARRQLRSHRAWATPSGDAANIVDPRHRPWRAGDGNARARRAHRVSRVGRRCAPRRLSHRFRQQGAARRLRRRGSSRRRPALARPRAARRRRSRRARARAAAAASTTGSQAFGIECSIRHNAASDALATAELLLRLRAHRRGTGSDDVPRARRRRARATMAGQRGLRSKSGQPRPVIH